MINHHLVAEGRPLAIHISHDQPRCWDVKYYPSFGWWLDPQTMMATDDQWWWMIGESKSSKMLHPITTPFLINLDENHPTQPTQPHPPQPHPTPHPNPQALTGLLGGFPWLRHVRSWSRCFCTFRCAEAAAAAARAPAAAAVAWLKGDWWWTFTTWVK